LRDLGVARGQCRGDEGSGALLLGEHKCSFGVREGSSRKVVTAVAGLNLHTELIAPLSDVSRVS
jgi:hypothetical protein